MIRPAQLIRLIHINYVLAKHGLDEIILEMGRHRDYMNEVEAQYDALQGQDASYDWSAPTAESEGEDRERERERA